MSEQIIPAGHIALRIRRFRGEKVLLDLDLAVLHGVAVKVLNQSVKRNRERFPNDAKRHRAIVRACTRDDLNR